MQGTQQPLLDKCESSRECIDEASITEVRPIIVTMSLTKLSSQEL